MSNREIRVITKSNATGVESNELIISPSATGKPSNIFNTKVTTPTTIDRNAVTITTVPKNTAVKPTPLPPIRSGEVIKAATTAGAYQKFLNDFTRGTSAGGADGAHKTETCAAQISSNLAKIFAAGLEVKRKPVAPVVATAQAKASKPNAPALQVRVMPKPTASLLLRTGDVTTVATKRPPTSAAPMVNSASVGTNKKTQAQSVLKDYSRQSVRMYTSVDKPTTETGIKRTQLLPDDKDNTKRPRLWGNFIIESCSQGSMPFANSGKLKSGAKPISIIKIDSDKLKKTYSVVTQNHRVESSVANKSIDSTANTSVTNRIPSRRLSDASGSSKMLKRSYSTAIATTPTSAAKSSSIKSIKAMTPQDIKETLQQVYEQNIKKIDMRNSTGIQNPTSQKRTEKRSKSMHAIKIDKMRGDSDNSSAFKPPKITQESFESKWDSLTEILSSTAAKSQKSVEKKITPKGDVGKKLQAVFPLKTGTTTEFNRGKSISASSTAPTVKTIIRTKQMTTAEPPGNQRKVLSLPFMNDLNETIAWNRQNRIGTLSNGVLTFERNEFGMIELQKVPTITSANKCASKLKKNKKTDLLLSNQCNHENFDVCFNAVLMRWGDNFWMNQTTPIGYHSNELKEIIRSCIKKHHHKCNLVALGDIQEAMAASKYFKEAAQSMSSKFEWDTYLNYWNSMHESKLNVAPIKFFFNPMPSAPNPFLVGQKLEAIDPKNCALFCVCTVVDVRGYRIKLHFDGYHMAYDFWTNADSTQIFPIGWCERTARELQPPPGYTPYFKWSEYLNKTNSIAAPRSNFSHLNTSSGTSHNPFKIGMKLEADDIKNTRKLCVATIGDVIDNHVLITLDGLDRQSNYWADVDSPYLHPVNWHLQHGYSIQPPGGWKFRFVWKEYLRAKRAEAVPSEAFCSRNPIQFAVGMVLEVVDVCNPSIIRPARIVMVDDYEIKVLFLEWPESYAFWLSDDSPDIHPTGWCRRTGHPIIGPQYGEDAADLQTTCGIPRCNGIGNIRYPDQFAHRTSADCPYSNENWSNDKKFGLPNRLGTASLKSFRVPNVDLDGGTLADQSPLLLREGVSINSNPKFSHKALLDPPELKRMSPKEVELYRRLHVSARHLIDKSANLSILHDKWLEKLQPLKPVQILVDEKNPLNWTIREVADFVSKLPNGLPLGRVFVDHEIDGGAFLSLRQSDMMNHMGLSLGASIKVFNRIVLLREECNAKYIKYN